jgi:exodeoxyribonuclease V gamma subunit
LTLEGVLGKVTEHGLVIYRHARPNSRDYLRAWLAHLVLCALPASVLAGSARRTLWLGDGTSFAYREVDAAPERLAAMLALYRAGRRMPLPFFPRSAFAHVSEGEAAALRCFEGTQQSVGESSDPYVRIAFAGREPVLDSRFTELAAEVFKPLIDHLDLDGAVANTGFASEGELS